MRNALLAIITLFLFSFCEKEFSIEKQFNPLPACANYVDWTGYGIPLFQGNCYLATNAQIRYMQQQTFLPTVTLAPDNNNIPTKAQIQSYCNDGSTWNPSPEYIALGNSNCAPIGWLSRIA